MINLTTLIIKPKLKIRTKKSNPAKNITDILPLLRIENYEGYIVLKDNYLEVLQIESKDILSLSENGVNTNIYNFQTFLRSYQSDFKLVVMDFPVDTSSQQRYIEYKMKTCKNESYKEFLKDRLKELKEIGNETDVEYYIFIFGKTKESLKDKIDSFKELFFDIADIHDLDKEKRIKILYKLNNLNSKI